MWYSQRGDLCYNEGNVSNHQNHIYMYSIYTTCMVHMIVLECQSHAAYSFMRVRSQCDTRPCFATCEINFSSDQTQEHNAKECEDGIQAYSSVATKHNAWCSVVIVN